jgi:hypothetical protein
MSCKLDWTRTARTIVIAGLLMLALLCAVLGSVGTKAPLWAWLS